MPAELDPGRHSRPYAFVQMQYDRKPLSALLPEGLDFRKDAVMFMSFNARALGLDLTVDETLFLASAAGFEGVDLLVRDLVERGGDRAAIRSRMDRLGLRGGAWPLPVDWRGNAGSFARDLNRLPRYAEAAAVLGLHRTGTWVLPETPRRPESEPAREAHLAEVMRWHVDRLGAIAHILGEHGCRFGLEVIGVPASRTGRGLPFLHRLADLDRSLGALKSEAPNLGIVLDGFHLYAAGETVEAGLVWGVERIVTVHLADLPASSISGQSALRDNERGLPGENGAIDSGALLRRLAKAGYQGPVSAEPMQGCQSLAGLTARASADKTASALRSVWPS